MQVKAFVTSAGVSTSIKADVWQFADMGCRETAKITRYNSRLKVKVHDSSVRYTLNGCGSLGRVREFRELSMNEMKRRCKDETAPQ